MLDAVYRALQEMRPPFAPYEADIHQMVGEALAASGLAFTHETRIGKGCRIDFLAEGIGVEIKKGKPIPATLLRQLARYAACEPVSALIVVTQRSVRLPASVGGKPLRTLALHQLWGVSLP